MRSEAFRPSISMAFTTLIPSGIISASGESRSFFILGSLSACMIISGFAVTVKSLPPPSIVLPARSK